ncbi:MAG TPA: tetratricopeptide repeat protein [Humisphaera sp.]|jgi:tetratricopeptide (TPR) repeat protein|nr:tetratricopeptide repeat protein [Humisphaera sp.]
MKNTILYTTVLIAMSLAGCAKNGPQTARPNPSEFETVKDPPIATNTYFAAGQLAESRQQYDKAEVDYRRALRDNPNHKDALYRLGCMLAMEKKYPQAIIVWKQYVKATDSSAEAYSNLAYCEELAGNPAAAEADYRRGITADSKNEACRVNFGLMLARHNRVNEGVLQLQAVLSPAEVHYDLAGIYELQRRPELAKAEYQAALELDPEMTEAKAKLAQLENE